MTRRHQPWSVLLAACLVLAGGRGVAQQWPFEVSDLTDRTAIRILVFGDAGTGEPDQYRVGEAMFEVCQRIGCDLALMLGDNLYEDGVEVEQRRDGAASFRDIMSQFADKFARPYASFERLDGFHFWAVLGNHDYRRNASGAMVTYSEFSDLWRLPALHYEIPRLPEWVQIQAVHTDTDVRRDLNGLQVASIRQALCDETRPDRWKILFGHHPVYNSGHHRGDRNEQRARALLEAPLIKECGVHFYLSGHAHHQEHLTARGFEQVVQGAAAKLRGQSRAPDEPGVRQRFFSKTFGFAILTVDSHQARLDFYDVLDADDAENDRAGASLNKSVRSYSWCGARADVGQASREPTPCATDPN